MYGEYRKYKNRKTSVYGMTFDSKKEADHFVELELMQRAGIIKDLRRQVKFVLIPSQRGNDGKVIERECSYIADFVYMDCETGKQVVEDVKGYRGGGAYEVYKIKRKLMLHVHGIRVIEI